MLLVSSLQLFFEGVLKRQSFFMPFFGVFSWFFPQKELSLHILAYFMYLNHEN